MYQRRTIHGRIQTSPKSPSLFPHMATWPSLEAQELLHRGGQPRSNRCGAVSAVPTAGRILRPIRLGASASDSCPFYVANESASYSELHYGVNNLCCHIEMHMAD